MLYHVHIYVCAVHLHNYMYIHLYVHTYVCIYVDIPVVEITASGGCGYVFVSMTSTVVGDMCKTVRYNVTLSSSIINMTESNTSMNTHHFTELPNNTQFNVTVVGYNMMGRASDPVSTSVETNNTCMFEVHMELDFGKPTKLSH